MANEAPGTVDKAGAVNVHRHAVRIVMWLAWSLLPALVLVTDYLKGTYSFRNPWYWLERVLAAILLRSWIAGSCKGT